MTRDEARHLVWDELACVLDILPEARVNGCHPSYPTLKRTVESIVQRLYLEGGLRLEDEPVRGAS